MSVAGSGTSQGDIAAGLLVNGLSNWDLELSAKDREAFSTYADMLIDWNANRFNLTRLVSPDQIALNHFLDSAALTQVAKVSRNSTLVDIGTGAGFPGLAFKILRPDIKLVLIESTSKKLNFCRAVADAVGLVDIDFVHGRAEDPAVLKMYGGKAAIVTARAVAPLRTLIDWTVPLAASNGSIVAWKGARVHEEVLEAEASAQKHNLKMDIVQVPLTVDGIHKVSHFYVICRRK